MTFYNEYNRSRGVIMIKLLFNLFSICYLLLHYIYDILLFAFRNHKLEFLYLLLNFLILFCNKIFNSDLYFWSFLFRSSVIKIDIYKTKQYCVYNVLLLSLKRRVIEWEDFVLWKLIIKFKVHVLKSLVSSDLCWIKIVFVFTNRLYLSHHVY